MFSDALTDVVPVSRYTNREFDSL